MLDLPPANRAFKELREHIDITQDDFARKIGVSYALIRSIEHGATVSPGTIQRLATFLSIPDAQYESFADYVRHGGSLKSLWDNMQPQQSQGLVSLLYSEADLQEFLAPEIDNFVGREDTLIQIGEALREPGYVLLTGFASVGKTSIARKVIERWLRSPEFRGDRALPALWVEVNEDEYILDALGRRLVKDYATSIRKADSSSGKLMEELRKFGLIVLDNVRADDLSALVKRLPHKVAVLITARHAVRFSERTQQIVVEGLERHDALQLLSTYADADYSHDLAAEQLCDKLLGHPYSIQIAGSLIRGRRHSLDYVSELLTPLLPGFDRFLVLVEEALNDIHDDLARRVFMAIGALYAATVTPELLALFLDMSEKEVRAHLLALEQRFLVLPIHRSRKTPIYRVHEIAFSDARKKWLKQNDVSADSMRTSALQACRALIQKCAKEADVDGLERLDDARDNLLGVAFYASERPGTDGAALADLMKELVNCGYFDHFGYTSLALKPLDWAARYAEEHGDTGNVHRLWAKLGNGHANFIRNLELARKAYSKALESAPNANRRAISLVLLGTVNFRLNREQEALDHYRQAEAVATEDPSNPDVEALSFLYEHWGHMQAQFYDDHAGAFTYFQESHRYASQIADEGKRVFRIIYANLNMSGSQNKLGQQEGAQEHYWRALEYAQEALKDSQRLHADVLSAYAYIEIGEQYHGLNERKQAENAFRDALQLLRQTDHQRAQDLATFMRDQHYNSDAH